MDVAKNSNNFEEKREKKLIGIVKA
jgi:hypothetical protein